MSVSDIPVLDFDEYITPGDLPEAYAERDRIEAAKNAVTEAIHNVVQAIARYHAACDKRMTEAEKARIPTGDYCAAVLREIIFDEIAYRAVAAQEWLDNAIDLGERVESGEYREPR